LFSVFYRVALLHSEIPYTVYEKNLIFFFISVITNCFRSMIPEEYVKYGLYGAAGLGLLVELPNIKLGMPATNIGLRNMKRPNKSLGVPTHANSSRNIYQTEN
jgi:hypothetical protein